MSAQKSFLLFMLISIISLKNVYSFSDYRQYPLRLKYNNEIKQQFYEINNSHEGQTHVSSRFLHENTDVTANRNLLAYGRIPRQIPSRKLNTLNFHWGHGVNRYGGLRKLRFSDRVIDVRGVSLMRNIPMNVVASLFLMISLNVVINIIVLAI